MKSFIIICVVLISGFNIHAQQHSYDYLVKQYCAEARKMEIIKKPKDQIFSANIALSNKLRHENSDTIDAIISNIKAANDTLTQMEAMIIYSKRYIHSIIYNCNYYLQINRMVIDSCPPKTKSLQYITLRINQYLSTHPDFTYQQVIDSTAVKGFEYSREIEDQVQSDYGMPVIMPNTMITFLLHKSDLFFQAWLYRQSLKLFE